MQKKDISLKRIAVVGDRTLMKFDEKTNTPQTYVLAANPVHLDHLVALALNYQIDQLWIAPGSQISKIAARTDIDNLTSLSGFVNGHKSANSDGITTCIHAWQTFGSWEDKREISIMFPEHDARWGWEYIGDKLQLLYAVSYLRNALGLDIDWSPGHVSRSLMIKTLSSATRASWAAAADVSMLPPKMAMDVRWKQDISRLVKWGYPDAKAFYLHAWDKNSAYLGAATSAKLGEGEPVHMENPIERGLPGIYEVTLPDVMKELYQPGTQWIWQAELEYLIRTYECYIPVHQAYIWPTYHQALRPWAEDLWNARKWLDSKAPGAAFRYPEAADSARSAVKRIATQGLGWLAHKPKNAEDLRKWYKPHWWNMIVSEASSKMLYKAASLTANGHHVCWIDVDTIGIVSTVEAAQEAAPEMYERAGLMGGFKHAWSVEITPEIIAAFAPEVKFRATKKVINAAIGEDDDE